MNANPLDLSPSQIVWGQFYTALHQSAQRLKILMENTAAAPVHEASAATATEANQSTRPAKFSTQRRAGQTETTR